MPDDFRNDFSKLCWLNFKNSGKICDYMLFYHVEDPYGEFEKNENKILDVLER